MKPIFLTLTLTTISFAQQPAFEVTSVKVNQSGSGSSASPYLNKGTLRAENTTMRSILQAAFGMSSLQITGPAWIDADRYDLSAKSPAGVPDTDVMPMLQALLKDRFKLTAHTELKELPVYDMVLAKGGLKIFPANDPEHPLRNPPRGANYSMMGGQFTMSELAKAVTGPAGRIVVNHTGVEGKYGCILQFSPLSTQGSTGTADSGVVDIFAALEQQAGLKLEPKKEPIETLLVDRAERVPTEN